MAHIEHDGLYLFQLRSRNALIGKLRELYSFTDAQTNGNRILMNAYHTGR